MAIPLVANGQFGHPFPLPNCSPPPWAFPPFRKRLISGGVGEKDEYVRCKMYKLPLVQIQTKTNPKFAKLESELLAGNNVILAKKNSQLFHPIFSAIFQK
jgi:hypothetical protein